ncbi:MAG TPA: hypothetical protein VGU45_04860 [Microvirga sp.]|nr:hypothetical protein [Microvirga sp.]
MNPIPLPLAFVALEEKAARTKVRSVLSRYGFATVGPHDSWPEAAAWLDQNTPHVAVVEFLSRTSDALRICRGLTASGIPTVLYSTSDEQLGLPAELKGVPFLVMLDKEFMVLKRLATLHNERLVRRL